MDNLSKELTIIVHSCDAYSDLWEPFFTLLKRYWPDNPCCILLNTETKDFCFDGLEIKCVHPGKANAPYGQRLMEAVSKVKTPYILPLLDDFFLRRPVDLEQIKQIIAWMENDPQIVYFNCDCTPTDYKDYELDKYPGFHRLPPGNDYTYNMQAAVWRTDSYLTSWRKDVSPWEWEVYCNVLSYKEHNRKYYCSANTQPFLDYGHYIVGDIWGVFRGKWVIEDVGPLFEKEGISVDFTKRGIYDPNSAGSPIPSVQTRWDVWKRIYRCLGFRHLVSAVLVRLRHRGSVDYYEYLKQKARKAFEERKI